MPQAALSLLQGVQAGQSVCQGATSEPKAPACLLGWLQELGGCQGLGHPSRVGACQIAGQVQALGCNTGAGRQAGLRATGKGRHRATLLFHVQTRGCSSVAGCEAGLQTAGQQQAGVAWADRCEEETQGCSAGQCHVSCLQAGVDMQVGLGKD